MSSRGACLALRQHGFHQAQALVVAHLAPARDFGGGAQATLAKAIVAEAAHADAGTQDGAKGDDGHVMQISGDGCNDAGTKAGVGCYTSLCGAITSR
jgi:hypothetical protein